MPEGLVGAVVILAFAYVWVCYTTIKMQRKNKREQKT